ncbi:MAG: PD-(D/E)XK nuclease family protein [Spirosomataceae bacterium]
MKKFLEEVVDSFLKEKDITELANSCFILPSRRACYYFKRTLAQKLQVPVVSPTVISMDDFIVQSSGLTNIDSMELLFEVYGLFQKIDASISLNRFLGWGSALIKDFDTIDQALLASPKQLFAYMSEAKALERWKVNLPQEQPTSELQKTYFSLFENIYTVYEQLHEKLQVENKAYRGMAYRYVAENTSALLLEPNPSLSYFFVGLNALSKAEEKIIKSLVDAKRATTFWDTDSFYMRSTHKAGQVLRTYKKDSRFGAWNWEFDYLKKSSKKITIYPVSNTSLQAKLIADLTQKGEKDMAWVLSDDQILPTLLPSLPDSVDSYNITMGVSLKQSIVYSWLEVLFQLQFHKLKKVLETGETRMIPAFHIRDIRKCLEHPLFVRYIHKKQKESPESTVYKQVNEYISNRSSTVDDKVFLELFGEDALGKLVFGRWGTEVGPTLIAILDVFRETFKEMQDAVETEFLYQFMLLIQRLEGLVQRYAIKEIGTYKYVLFELIKQAKVPFSGEPIADLQVMSMLETRCLDFKHICLLSVNEGTIPSSKSSQSLIPFDAATEFGLPVYTDQDSIMSYHFFRLMQRADKIDIVYVLPSGSGVGGGGEPSRFIRQIMHELIPLNNQIEISTEYISFPLANSTFDNQEDFIVKSSEWPVQLRNYVENNGLSVSSINRIVQCELKFYYTDILRLRSLRDKEEIAGADTHGNVLHAVLEKIHKKEEWKIFSESTLREIQLQLPNLLDEILVNDFRTFDFDEGYNLLIKAVVLEQLVHYFENVEKRVNENEILNENAEFDLETILEKEILDEPWKIKLKGRIDKLERVGDNLFLIDYKSGKVERSDLKMEKEGLLQTLNLLKKDKFRQLWLYLFLYRTNYPSSNDALFAQIYSMRNLKDEYKISYDVISENFMNISEEFIVSILTRLLDETKPIIGTLDKTVCQFCDFKTVCKKDVK